MTKTFLKKLLQHSMLFGMVLSMGWFATPSHAAILACATPTPVSPTSVFPGNCDLSSAGVLVDSLSSPFTVSNANGDIVATGHLVTAVYQQTGTLDFYYQIFNDASSTDALHRNTDTDFTGFLTATAFRTNGSTLPGGLFVDGTIAPDLADRKSNSTVGFDFNGQFFGGEIAPGTVSNVILISTNATNYKPGSANVIDGGIASVKAFAPAAVPEPMSFILLGSGLLCLGLLRKKTKA